MKPDDAKKLRLLVSRLNEDLMSVALRAEEITQLAQGGIDDGVRADAPPNRQHGNSQRPLLDESTLSVIWNGKTLHLGNTQGFWLLARLARRPNHYVTHLDLLREIWDDEFADTAALRSGVRRLRVKLRRGGMGELASAIIGHHGRYMLDLSRMPRHSDVTTLSH